jgi:uncharacterized protein (DUF488 family)
VEDGTCAWFSIDCARQQAALTRFRINIDQGHSVRIQRRGRIKDHQEQDNTTAIGGPLSRLPFCPKTVVSCYQKLPFSMRHFLSQNHLLPGAGDGLAEGIHDPMPEP